MDKNDPYIHDSTNAHKPNVKKKHVHLANNIGKTSLKALNVHVTKAKFDFIFTMWICNMETQQREFQIANEFFFGEGDIKKSFINCKQLREWVSESEQLMRETWNVCSVVSITREFLAYLVGMLTQIKRMHSVPIYQTALFLSSCCLFWLTLPM